MAGWIQKRDDRPSPYLARYRLKSGRIESRAFQLRREAVSWLAEIQRREESGDRVDADAGAVSLGEYAEDWASRIEIRASTRSSYRGQIRSQLAPLLAVPLRDLTPEAVEVWLEALKAEQLSARTVRGAFSLLTRILSDAVSRRELSRSPLDDRDRFAVPKAPPLRNPKVRFLSRSEVGDLAEVIAAEYRAMVLLGAYAGLRWGEVASLAPDDLDEERRELAVRSNLAKTESGQPFRSAQMKTDNSARTIALGRLAVELAEHRDRFAAGDWLFPDSDGGPLRASNWRRRIWLPAVEEARLTPLRFHDLRHTHASLLIAQGESVLVVQQRLGHARPSITLDVYGSLFPGADEAAADRITAEL